MIRFSLSLLLLLTISAANGQELKEVVTRYKKSKAIMERYKVLRVDKKMKWGKYIAYFETGQTKVQIYFGHNVIATKLVSAAFIILVRPPGMW